ncbi:RES domain-containing protein [Streptomyces sp. 3MP-14]|uniref:RES domain-containing protein n=1 Tax=Streptomyces mimosae TaxID=2586635 RepID=A0A5N6AET4_9ACTN|nr:MULTISPECIES: RES family NAD+ phosphorylase [Streptomyces]KAB8166359.1 RES domain-containing protein [Streptomyces mimosae]KAB8174152.1 RES domain-containing protein [Streptomyces sp. 3MP-14]
MPEYAPPDGLTPRLAALPAGTRLWRCHRTRYPATAFNPVAAHTHFGGNRFDGTTSDPYPYLYAADEPATALAEVFLRSRPFGGPSGERLIPRAQSDGYALSLLTTTAPLALIQLVTEEDLAAVKQDHWLLEAEGAGAPQTRYWAQALRRDAPAAQGMLWQSRRRRSGLALVLFGDRCPAGALAAEPSETFDLSTPAGRDRANGWLAPLLAAIHP